ncbi:MAG: IclR family transcriptional regulator [Armatimonadota bacterium]|nr:IclR family transcriptional regulator [Armatimonadota bacterium]MDR7420976.1 IclR family transcriptional regulator [Armatimonadota bacterium]MDR7455419.1 IclR family transcriptional regulator [Armatimonadota bacterium]MDR7487124.1 IclR family transcriptional regulator [Armatimonadota bacterium]MDR7497413.1 IclR family transcriptional regulator [Armatimonadota bacterium]
MVTHTARRSAAHGAGVAAVDRALRVLAAFREGDSVLTLAEMAERTGMYKSTILRLCGSLERHGYLQRLEGVGYRLGPTPMRLASLYQRSFRLGDLVVPVLRDLVRRSGESASFYVREGTVRVCLHRVDSPRAVREHVREGDHLPLDRGAAGRVLLAFGGEEGEAYARIRRRYVTATFGERDRETAAVAAPVFGIGQDLAGALSISGPVHRFSPRTAARLAGMVLQAAADLTAALGGDRLPMDERLRRHVRAT